VVSAFTVFFAPALSRSLFHVAHRGKKLNPSKLS